MALYVSSSFRIQSCETHVSPLTPVPPQVEQDANVESKYGDQWDLFEERLVEFNCVVQVCSYNLLKRTSHQEEESRSQK